MIFTGEFQENSFVNNFFLSILFKISVLSSFYKVGINMKAKPDEGREGGGGPQIFSIMNLNSNPQIK